MFTGLSGQELRLRQRPVFPGRQLEQVELAFVQAQPLHEPDRFVASATLQLGVIRHFQLLGRA